MINQNLRHLRIFLKVVEAKSITLASEQSGVSQSAVTQIVSKLEREAKGALFTRTRQGALLTERGKALAARLSRFFSILDPALAHLSPRLCLTATESQLKALIASREEENFTLAARRIGLSQPTVHKAVRQLEQAASQSLFVRTAFGMLPTRACHALAQAAQLAFYELEQVTAEFAELDGGEAGHIVLGALPLARSVILPHALVQFREIRPHCLVTVLEGTYQELFHSLRRGEVDFIIGALRNPAPIEDVEQETLFEDRLVLLCGLDHPLANSENISLNQLAAYPWVVPRTGTPTRAKFDDLFVPLGDAAPRRIIEAGSLLLMREILEVSAHLGCISSLQAHEDVAKGLLARLRYPVYWPARPIGLTYRRSWVPTNAQKLLLELIRKYKPSEQL